MGTDVTDEQARWRDDAIMRSNSTSLVERRVRMALGERAHRHWDAEGRPGKKNAAR
jgi:hypothetical protein